MEMPKKQVVSPDVNDKQAAGLFVNKSAPRRTRIIRVAKKTILSIKDERAMIMRQNQVIPSVIKPDEESVGERNLEIKGLDHNDCERKDDQPASNAGESTIATSKVSANPQRKRKYKRARMSTSRAATKHKSI